MGRAEAGPVVTLTAGTRPPSKAVQSKQPVQELVALSAALHHYCRERGTSQGYLAIKEKQQ